MVHRNVQILRNLLQRQEMNKIIYNSRQIGR